ncbi:MAG: hypothetical protein KF858_09530 [Candidatus Sumerlaeia bacterium]|nr:hypothetical protein [Candidatus Sumerlaeia bacterium]
MKPTRQSLTRIAEETGFRAEYVEKVLWFSNKMVCGCSATHAASELAQTVCRPEKRMDSPSSVKVAEFGLLE